MARRQRDAGREGMTNRVYDVCQTEGCINAPWTVGAKFCAACKKSKRDERNHRQRPLSDAPCAKPGCDNRHHGRSRYCLEHLSKPRGTSALLGEQVSLKLARHMLYANDLPQRLTPYQRVTVMDVKTFKWREVEL